MTLAVVIALNNYFHDLATGVLFGCAAVLWVVSRRVPTADADRLRLLAEFAHVLGRLAAVAVAWIVIGGIPRVIFFSRFEWDPSVTRGIVPALVIKHILLVSAVGFGSWLWFRTSRRLRVHDSEE